MSLVGHGGAGGGEAAVFVCPDIDRCRVICDHRRYHRHPVSVFMIRAKGDPVGPLGVTLKKADFPIVPGSAVSVSIRNRIVIKD